MRGALARCWYLCGARLLLTGCATIPDGRYGVDELQISGVQNLDKFALEACLATHEREWLSIDLSRDPAPTCGKPPFDARRIHLPMWRWAWTEWPLYDPSIFERDLSRIERWYRARGYYGARVLETSSVPSEALYGTLTDRNKIRLYVTVLEGDPVRVLSVTLDGTAGLHASVSQELMTAANAISIDDRFDEAIFDETKAKLVRILRDAGYAAAAVEGHVNVDMQQKTAVIQFHVKPGAYSEFGDVCVEGFGKLPPELILQTGDLRPGHPFSESDLEDARTRIYQLRVFSDVEIVTGHRDPKTGASEFQEAPRLGEGEFLDWQNGQALPSAKESEATERVCRFSQSKSKRPRVPIEIRVKPAKLYRLGVGAGVQIGVEDGQRAINAAQQWDVHLYGYAEVRNFIGGLRRLRIEERPRLIFLSQFPFIEGNGTDKIRLGNNLNTLLEWPAFLEARTLLRLIANWDHGPDPYGAKFIRDDIDIGLGPSRNFLRNRLRVAAYVHVNPYIPQHTYGTTSETEKLEAEALLKSERYNLFFLEQDFEWDTRDDRTNTHTGTLARIEIDETLPPSNWTYLRLLPELRHFIPLPYGLVLAARGGIGWLGIFKADKHLSEELQRLGPRPYRLRGGGPYSVRGVPAAALGEAEQPVAGFPGGTRSWIFSTELRIPLGDSFGVATFIDLGDVYGGSPTQKARFRFDNPNTTFGGGLRYKTIVGPLRLDVGWLVPGLQGPAKYHGSVSQKSILGFNGAIQLTIGEAF